MFNGISPGVILYYQTMLELKEVENELPPLSDFHEGITLAREGFEGAVYGLNGSQALDDLFENELPKSIDRTKIVMLKEKEIGSQAENLERFAALTTVLTMIEDEYDEEKSELTGISKKRRVYKLNKLNSQISKIKSLKAKVDFYKKLVTESDKEIPRNLLGQSTQIDAQFFANYIGFLSDALDEGVSKKNGSYRKLQELFIESNVKKNPDLGRQVAQTFLETTSKIVEARKITIEMVNNLVEWNTIDEEKIKENILYMTRAQIYMNNVMALGESIDLYFKDSLPKYKSYASQASRIKTNIKALAEKRQASATKNNKESQLIKKYNQIFMDAFAKKVPEKMLSEINEAIQDPTRIFHHQIQPELEPLIPNIIKFEEKGAQALKEMKARLLKSYSKSLREISLENLEEKKEQIVIEQRREMVNSFTDSLRYIMMLRDLELYLASHKVQCDRESTDHLIPESLANFLHLDGLEDLIEDIIKEKRNSLQVESESRTSDEEIEFLNEEVGEELPKFHYSITSQQEELTEELVQQKILPETALIETRFKFANSSPKAVKTAILNAGFKLECAKDGKGSHSIYRKGICMITLPKYKDRIPKGTLRSIERVIEKSKNLQQEAPVSKPSKNKKNKKRKK